MRQNSLFHSIVLCAAVIFGLVAPQCEAAFHMGVPRLTGPNVHSAQSDVEPCLSGDGLSLYFGSNREGGYYAIYQSRRLTQDAEWGSPEKLPAPVNDNGTWDTGGPSLSFDGLTLYFSSARPGTLAGVYSDIWMATRASQDAPWGEPVNLGTAVNSSVADWAPCISHDELSLYFTTGRTGNYDIYVTIRPSKDDPWGPAQSLGVGLNSGSADGHPSVSADHLTLFYASDRSNGFGNMDIWMCVRSSVDSPWGEPANLGTQVNTPSYEGMPELSWDGLILYVAAAYPGSPTALGDIWEIPILPVVDFTGDYQVGIEDLTWLIEHWGQNEPSIDMAPTPFGDGIVDVNDLEILMSYWGQELFDPHFIAHWKLDEADGNVAHDCIADNDGVVMGDALWQSEEGHVDGSLRLDGVNGYVETPFLLNPKDGVFSLFAWIKGSEPGQTVISQGGGANWLLTDAQGCLMTALTGDGRQAGSPLCSEMIVTDGSWHRIGLVWDGSYRSLYVDDTLVAIDVGVQNNFSACEGKLFIGAANNLQSGRFWSGMIDDVCLYDRVVYP